MTKNDLCHPKKQEDFSSWQVSTDTLGKLAAYRYVVVFARCRDEQDGRLRWLYCRAGCRDSFETPGGKMEAGETALDAAKRELYEETGAVRYAIRPAFDYRVQTPAEAANGQVFLADIEELGELPAYEMAEVRLFDSIPEKMRFPKILPVLYNQMQRWINTMSAKEELWDIYDADRNPTGKVRRRSEALQDGEFHLVALIWLQNSRGDFFITKRAGEKGYPYLWECTGGAACSGEDSRTAAIREMQEEAGLTLDPEKGACLFTETTSDTFFDVWLFRQDFDLETVVLQEGETIDAKYASKEEILLMAEKGEFVAPDFTRKMLEAV